jgi:hypothetical protein
VDKYDTTLFYALVGEIALQDDKRSNWRKYYKEKPRDFEDPMVQDTPKCLLESVSCHPDQINASGLVGEIGRHNGLRNRKL